MKRHNRPLRLTKETLGALQAGSIYDTCVINPFSSCCGTNSCGLCSTLCPKDDGNTVSVFLC